MAGPDSLSSPQKVFGREQVALARAREESILIDERLNTAWQAPGQYEIDAP